MQTGCSGSDCSEDCLFLNIWTPYLLLNGRAPQTKPKIVMFWIHGGAFTGGTGADPTFGGGNMESRGDVVMVAIRVQICNHLLIVLHDTGRGFCRCETDPQCYWLLRPYNATSLFESL